jgi:hypothetical protein
MEMFAVSVCSMSCAITILPTAVQQAFYAEYLRTGLKKAGSLALRGSWINWLRVHAYFRKFLRGEPMQSHVQRDPAGYHSRRAGVARQVMWQAVLKVLRVHLASPGRKVHIELVWMTLRTGIIEGNP